MQFLYLLPHSEWPRFGQLFMFCQILQTLFYPQELENMILPLGTGFLGSIFSNFLASGIFRLFSSSNLCGLSNTFSFFFRILNIFQKPEKGWRRVPRFPLFSTMPGRSKLQSNMQSLSCSLFDHIINHQN